jgi:post-segregation antitoxin (ccd killing protein)
MKATIYMPDELHAQLRAADVNVSAACQAALTKELDRVNAVADLDEKTERIVVETEDEKTVAFNGSLVTTYDPRGPDGPYAVYLTPKRYLVVVGEDKRGIVFETYNNFEAFADSWSGPHIDMVHEVALGIGEDFVIELDL